MKKPSVTEILNLLDKPGLLKWANNIGLDGIGLDDYRKKCLKKGSSLHFQIQDFIENGKGFEDLHAEENCIKFLQDKDVISMEKEVETDFFVGRYDIKYKHKNRIILADFKSSSGVYLENVLQLVSYNMAKKADALAVVEIPSFKVKEISIKDIFPFVEMMKSLSNVYNMKGAAKWKA